MVKIKPSLSKTASRSGKKKDDKWPLGHSLDWFAVLSSMKTAGQKHLKLSLSLWCSAGQSETDVCNLT